MRIFPLFAIAMLLSSCQAQAPDLILVNGSIWTGLAGDEEATALAITGSRITAVGTDSFIMGLAGRGTEVRDLDGMFAMPGFVDNHVHFLQGGFQLASVDLRDADSPEDFAGRLASFARSQPAGSWVTGGDWDHEAWGGQLPTRDWIDAATPDHPVFVSRLDGHMALANTLALELAGVPMDAVDPEGGTIVRNADGRPTGVLKDEAMSLVTSIIPTPDSSAFDQALQRAMQHAASLGVTQVHDVGSYGGWTDLDVYRRAHERDGLDVRIYAFVPLSTWPSLQTEVRDRGRGDDWLRWGGLKGFVDGSLGSTTAWFYDPYMDEPSTAGLLVNDTALVRRQILDADAAGLHLAIHAIGDRANDWLLDVFGEAIRTNGNRDRRFRIEHAQHLTDASTGRFAEMDVIPSMQPYHAADDGRWAEKRIGPERIRTTYAFRSLLDRGAALTFGSDWTVAPLDPLLGIHAAVTRQTIDGAHPDGWVPDQKITVEEALRAYTVSNAHAGFFESDTGTIEPGKFADLVVLSADPRAVEQDSILDLNVVLTLVGGRTVYRRETQQ